MKHVAGSATIACTITSQGALRDCRVVAESPEGLGFGPAALALAPQFLMRPGLKNGQPVEATVRIPIIWKEVPGEVADRMLAKPEAELGTRLAPRSKEALNANRMLSGFGWSQAPTVADVRAACPAKARAEKRDGRVVLNCRLNRTGGLHDCDTVVEEPRGYGFSSAAKTLVEKFVGPTADTSGALLSGAHAEVPITFAASGLDTDTPVIGKPQWAALPTAEDSTLLSQRRRARRAC